jgi:hypothetical protein
MNRSNRFAIVAAVLAGAGLISILPLKSQTPNAVPAVVLEQYRILSGRLPNSGQAKTDAQIERELNALAAEGWKVRAANEGAIILAR